MRTWPLFLAGRWQETPHLHEVRSPWSGEPVGAVHLASAAHVEQALVAGKAARAAMSALPAWRRREILDGVAAGLRTREAEFAERIAAEAGKPIRLARAEVQRARDTFGFAADEAGRLDGEVRDLGAAAPGEGRHGIIRRFPIGLVAAITPFNFPLNLVAHKIAPAIAAGCPIVLKPAPQAPLSAFALAELCAQAGLPAGGLSVLQCSNEDADPLVTDARVHLLTFTGSAAVGWQLKARAGHKRVLLELGGNAAALVCADARLDHAAARIAQGAFGYAGQSCISVQRVLVHHSRWDELVRRLLDEIDRAVPTGSPADEAVVCGPVIDSGEADRLRAWIDEAVQDGATLVRDGGRDGNLLGPTVLARVPHHCMLYSAEAFGPVVCLEAWRDLDDAIRRVNDSPFGLQAGVFTDSLSTLWRCYEGLDVGGVIHDDVPTFRVDHMPYGGVKDSGQGREGLREAIRAYTEPKLLALRPG